MTFLNDSLNYSMNLSRKLYKIYFIFLIIEKYTPKAFGCGRLFPGGLHTQSAASTTLWILSSDLVHSHCRELGTLLDYIQYPATAPLLHADNIMLNIYTMLSSLTM